MKKIIIGLTLLLSLISVTGFATGEEKISPETLLSFQKEFKHAENVNWTKVEDIARASFNLNGFHVEAYFEANGQLLGTARNILFNQLPLAVVNSIDNRFQD